VLLGLTSSMRHGWCVASRNYLVLLWGLCVFTVLKHSVAKLVTSIAE
jgi:hypothetical protein